MQQQSYTQLVEAARKGESFAYEELYRRTSGQMMGLALSMLKHEQDALDVLQDSYLYAFGKLDQLENPEAFSSWLYRLVANRCKNFLTRTRPKLFAASLTDEEGEEREMEDEDSTARPDEHVDNAETRRLVMEMVDALPEEQRICVLLHYFQDKKVSEIAELLEISENTVKSRLNYARKKLRVQANDLERQGTLLHGVALMPIISRALADSVSRSLSSNGPEILQQILQGTGAGSAAAGASSTAATAGGGTGAAGGTSFLGTVAGKVTVGIITAAVAVSCAVALLSRPEPEPVPDPEPVVSETPAIVEEPEPEPEPLPEPEPDIYSVTYLFQDEDGNPFSGVIVVGLRLGDYTIVLEDRVLPREGLYSDKERADGQAIITVAEAQALELLWDFDQGATSLSFSTPEAYMPTFHYERENGSTTISRRSTKSRTIVVERSGNGIQFAREP